VSNEQVDKTMSNTNDPARWMWAEACELVAQAERLQRQFFLPTAAPTAPAAWEPPADVYEDAREIVVVIAMPGVSEERMQIISESGVLIVRGSRPLPLVGPGHALRRLEIPHGNFERRIPLPPGRMELGPPEVQHGCLILRLRKLTLVQR
jgi:HSP20 family protein